MTQEPRFGRVEALPDLTPLVQLAQLPFVLFAEIAFLPAKLAPPDQRAAVAEDIARGLIAAKRALGETVERDVLPHVAKALSDLMNDRR